MNDTDPFVFKSLSSKMLGSQDVSIPKCNKSEILQFLSCSKNYRLQLEMVYAFNPGPHEAEAGRSKLEVSHNYILDPPSLSKQSKLQISEHSGFADQGYSTNSNFINCIKAYFCKYQSSIFLQEKKKPFLHKRQEKIIHLCTFLTVATMKLTLTSDCEQRISLLLYLLSTTFPSF